ncbi:uncharacterized protein LOC101241641 isoform X1 [Hydra vulgaris]|uniref:uncharacterized protein LOC101241641 isoform X1 n=1 Tax=Hydra vulgaris TaxID=6087 RepID=UPI001F5FA1F5|nr:uncharacterized protein LOC101241641 isoform X1 [Hydra vulgaris]
MEIKSDEDRISVWFENEVSHFKIEDLNPDTIAETIGLDFKPTTLIHKVTKNVIKLSKIDEFKVGQQYKIKSRINSTKSKDLLLWDSDSFKHILQNTVILSKSAYCLTDEECKSFLKMNMTKHYVENIFRSQDDSCPFIVAEELISNRVYISFRGSQSISDWKECMKAFKCPNISSTISTGKFHAGFLNRAKKFPLQKVLNNKDFAEKSFVFCGHSMGGAVATIVAIFAIVEEEKKRKATGKSDKNRQITCFTFGAPLVGDLKLKQFCDKNGISKYLYHSVNFMDPIPRLLSYGICLEAMSKKINEQVAALVQCLSKESSEHFDKKKNDLIKQKSDYVEMLGKVAPILEMTLNFACCVTPKDSQLRNIASMGKDIIASIQSMESFRKDETNNLYMEIGNFLFLSDSKNESVKAPFNKLTLIQEHMEFSKKLCFDQNIIAHNLENYEETLKIWGIPSSPFSVVLQCGIGQDSFFEGRTIKLINPYLPKIDEALLTKLFSEKNNLLRLRLTGINLDCIVIEKCNFNLGFPFGNNVDKIRMSITVDDSIDVVHLDQNLDINDDINLSDHGTEIIVTTLFGSCRYQLKKDQLRELNVLSVSQFMHNDNVSKLIKMAIQRGIGMAEINKISSGFNKSYLDVPIVKKVKKLAGLCSIKNEIQDANKIFCYEAEKANFILSNEMEYEKIKKLCDMISDYLKSPLKIEAQTSVTKMIGLTIATVTGGGIFAVAAGPGLLMIGAIEAVSGILMTGVGVFGGLGTGIVTHLLWKESIVEENYREILNYILKILIKHSKNEKEKDEIKIQKVSDLREDGSTHSLEKALLMVYNKAKGVENFSGTDLEKCSTNSKEMIVQRIKCIKVIHQIREILSKQCYIGVVGIQNAGKTTLLKKIWDIQGEVGMLKHTTKPQTYKINKNIYVVDFPGNNSLDYHSKTFSICGSMNNLIILVTLFTGDINEMISKEIANVFKVMEGSDSTKVILCINQCGPKLKDLMAELEEIKNEPEHPNDELWMKNLKQKKTGMATSLAQKFSDKLNEYYKGKFCISHNDILFTDWMVGDESSGDSSTFGLFGVEEIKKRIREYLIQYNIYDKNDEELNKCFEKRMILK